MIVVLAGLLGGTLGFAASAVLAIWYAKAKGISSIDGAHGYLAVVAGIVGGLIASILAMILCLRWQGVTNLGSLITSTLSGGLTIAILAACLFGAYWLSIPKRLNQNGTAPQLLFEIVPPAGFEPKLKRLRASLHCNSQERPEVQLSSANDDSENGLHTISGRVELIYRASWRLIALDLAEDRSILFRLRLPSDPTQSAKLREWSQWYTADEVKTFSQHDAEQAKTEPSEFKIRYRIEFWREPRQ